MFSLSIGAAWSLMAAAWSDARWTYLSGMNQIGVSVFLASISASSFRQSEILEMSANDTSHVDVSQTLRLARAKAATEVQEDRTHSGPICGCLAPSVALLRTEVYDDLQNRSDTLENSTAQPVTSSSDVWLHQRCRRSDQALVLEGTALRR